MTGQVILAPTADVHIELAIPFYEQNTLARQFVDCLDLSPAQPMIDVAKQRGFYDLAREQAIARKHSIRKALLAAIKETPSQKQILILAAGLDPLSIEMLDEAGEQIAHVYEVDLQDLETKKKIFNRIAPGLCPKISVIREDVTSDRLQERLQVQGFSLSRDTIVVMEGISHYLSRLALEELLISFQSEDAGQQVILEFSIPYDDIDLPFREEVRAMHTLIEAATNIPPMTKYPVDEIKDLFQRIGGRAVEFSTAHDAEKEMTGGTPIFPKKNSGWLQVCRAEI